MNARAAIPMFKTTLATLTAFSILFLSSCSQQEYAGKTSANAPSVYSSHESAAVHDQSAASEGYAGKVAGLVDSSSSVTESAVQDPALDQKIIYTASIRLITTNFDTFPAELGRLAKTVGGFVAETDVARMQGLQRSGRWVVRVPGNKYHDFIRDVGGLGIPESVQEKADDVTEQFVDIEARITSGRQLEDQIIKLLEKQNDKIENVLAVERELSRVRLEIERMEGRLRFLQSQVAMSTITIHASEQRTYVPDQAQTLGQRIELTWHRAVERFQNFITNTIVLIVANAFVIPAWIIGLSLFWVFVGRRIKKSWQKSPA